MKGLTDPLSGTLWCSGIAKLSTMMMCWAAVTYVNRGGQCCKGTFLRLKHTVIVLCWYCTCLLCCVNVSPAICSPVLVLDHPYVWNHINMSSHVKSCSRASDQPFKHAYLLCVTSGCTGSVNSSTHLLNWRHFHLLWRKTVLFWSLCGRMALNWVKLEGNYAV